MGYNNANELRHYGVKGMKWGVRKQRPTKSNSTKYDSLSEYERMTRAQASGSKALSYYKKIREEYDSRIDEAMEKDDVETLSKLQDELDERINKEVYKPLVKAGYDYVYSGWGSDGGLSLQFGKELSEVAYDKYGYERFVDDFVISAGDMKVYRTDDEW